MDKKVRTRTDGYTKRIAWAVVRILFAVISMSFFLYFFVDQVKKVEMVQVNKDVISLNDQFYDLFGMLVNERTYYMRVLCNMSHDSTQLEDFETIPTLWQTLSPSWTSDSFGYGPTVNTLIEQRDTINEKVLDNTIQPQQFLEHSITLCTDFTLLWQEVCRSANTEVQRYITSDVYRSRAVGAFCMERDITLYVLHNGSFVTNETEFQFLQNNYFGSQKIHDMFWDLSKLFFTGKQQEFFTALDTDPEYLSATSDINQTRLMVDSYFLEGTPWDPAQADIYLDAADAYLEKLSEGDAEEVSPDQKDVNIKFGISVVGTIVEMIAAINLLWLGLPIIVLIWRMHFGRSTPSQTSSSTPP
eukprot:TRINITY_DN18284_c0_g1_i1.p1 TRINITY_DN18284_c0_g1~~TRINITY_DN18284_c0_g1_i1.p1  ORF type:complete len:358 (-),score=73.67 TRINITY_DN18284_c0_g1_i1:25-1098(-)